MNLVKRHVLMSMGLILGLGSGHSLMGMEQPQSETKGAIFIKTANMTLMMPKDLAAKSPLLKSKIDTGRGNADNPIDLLSTESNTLGLAITLLRQRDPGDMHGFIQNLKSNEIDPLRRLLKALGLDALLQQLESGLQITGQTEKLAAQKEKTARKWTEQEEEKLKTANRLFVRNSSGGAITLQWSISGQNDESHLLAPWVLDHDTEIELGPIGQIENIKYAAYGLVWSWTSIFPGLHTYSRKDLYATQIKSQPQQDIIIRINSVGKVLGQEAGLAYTTEIEQLPQRKAAAAKRTESMKDYPALAFLELFPRVKWHLQNSSEWANRLNELADKSVAEMHDLLTRSIANKTLLLHYFLGLPENAPTDAINTRFNALMSRLPNGPWGRLAQEYLNKARTQMLEQAKLNEQSWFQRWILRR